MHCDGSSKVAKQRIDKYKSYAEKDEDDYEDSQEFLIKDILDSEKNIERLEKIKTKTDEKLII